jgi:hypothetical protein
MTPNTPDVAALSQVSDALHELTPVTLYVVEMGHPWGGGDIWGELLTWQGERLYTHVSSSADWLKRDLTENFGHGDQLRARFGDFTVVYVALTDPIPDAMAQYIKPFPAESSEATSS